MIKLRELLNEDRSRKSVEFGCLMAYISPKQCDLLSDFGKILVKDKDLYKEGNEYGRDDEAHVTIRYGFTADLTKEEINEIIKDVKSFTIKLKSISIFKASGDKKYDVVKFDVESDILTKLNKKSGKYPNEQSFPNYHPHVTIAYVKKGSFKNETKDISIEVTVDKIVYSPMKGEKKSIKLQNGVITESITQRNYDLEIQHLEQEWDRLDSMGGQEVRQKLISNDIEKLRDMKVKWEAMYNATV